MSKINNIPKHWQIIKLGKVLKVSSGKGLKVNSLQGGNHAVYGGNGINGYHSEYFIDNPKLIIGRVGVKCGVTHITKPKSWVTDNALIVEPIISDFDVKFFQLKLGYENLNKLSVSTAQPVISGSKIYEYEILLPPLPEQQLIVSRIEELLSDLENAKQQLQTAQQQLKIYRQSLLKWAFGNLKQEKTLEEIADDHSIGLVKSSKEQNENDKGIPYIKMNNVDLDGNVDFKKVVYVKVNPEEAKKYSLRKGDILINTRNSIELVGKTGIVRVEKPNCVFNNNLLRIRTKKEYNSLFIGYQLIGPWLRKQMTKEKKSTTNVCALYQRDIFPLKLKVASYNEQQLIVDELESKLTVCDKIEETISQSLLQTESLRQSILKKAFEGKLV